MEDSDDIDQLCEIVDALLFELTKKSSANSVIYGIAKRARKLRQKRLHLDKDDAPLKT